MLDLPATEVLKAECDRLYQQAAEIGGGWATRHDREIRFADYRLELGHERDAIRESRSPDCWCLGLGGRTVSYVPIYDGTTGELMEQRQVWRDCCFFCPDGAEAMEYRKQAHVASADTLQQWRINRVFGAPNLEGYEKAHLENVRVLEENVRGWERCLAWVDPNSETSSLSLLLHGPVGSGKTWAAVAMMRRRIELGEVALFVRMGQFLEQIRATFGRAKDGSDGPTTEDVLALPRRVQLLVLDDLGAEYGTRWAEDQILELLEARRTLPTLFTTNLDMLALREQHSERIASRVIGMCGGLDANIVHWRGNDRRLGGQ